MRLINRMVAPPWDKSNWWIYPTPVARLSLMARVIAAIPDLFFRAKVLETAKALAIDVEVARDADEVVRKVRAEKPRLVLIDLQAAALQPLELLPTLQGI